MQGLLGKKVGMTRVFNDAGQQVPVTVLEVGPCVVLQRKTQATDGYEALQIGFGQMTERRACKPLLGRCKAVNTPPLRHLSEVPLEAGDDFKAGDTLTAAIFKDIKFVDVTGVTKGRGFQGVVRRHRMSGGPHTHGGHSKRRVGSIGCRELPGRIHKGKRMPGHMGNVRITQQNLQVVQVRPEDNLLLVRGAVPGAPGSVVMIKKALKRK
jgi:large subunit ribosomal protein L3